MYVYTNLPVNTIVRLLDLCTGDSQGQETFLASSADNQTQNYDTECSNHNPSLSTLLLPQFLDELMSPVLEMNQKIFKYNIYKPLFDIKIGIS